MKKNITVLATLLFSSSFAFAQNFKAADTRIFIPMKGMSMTAGYGIITNNSKKDMIVSVEKAEFFKTLELHESFVKDEKAGMKKIETYTIAPSQSLEMKPGGHHLMLFDVSKDIKENDIVKVTLKINGKPESIDFVVVPRIQKSKKSHHNH